ncbi:MAG: diguanylate cyclase [Gammaproteobacteria bacterium]|nr:diguanylate cyclase [Gammaproteobacteria bacterium]
MQLEWIFRSLVANTNDVIMVMDATPLEEGGPKIVYVNPAFEQLMGYSAAEVIGQNPKLLQGPDTDDKTRYKIRQAMRNGKAIRTQILNYDKEGNQLWLDINLVPLFDEQGELAYYAAIERDLTEHKQMQSRLENMATTDSLTGLLNRQAFMHRAEQEFSRARRFSRPLSMVMIDVDHFKSINDEYGHAVGDQVLRAMGKVCQARLRDSDCLGRVGGEEFVLLLPDTPQANAMYVAERMRESLVNSPMRLDNLVLSITASFGVASLRDEDIDFNTVLARADAAMYNAKHGGRNQVKSAA